VNCLTRHTLESEENPNIMFAVLTRYTRNFLQNYKIRTGTIFGAVQIGKFVVG